MTIASVLVTSAYREGNLIPTGKAPTTAEAAEGLSLLNVFIDSLYGFELGEFEMAWPVPPSTTSPVKADYPVGNRSSELPDTVWPYPPGNVTILMNLAAATTIYLPQAPNDGARISFVNIGDPTSFSLTVDANGRLVQGALTLVDTPGNFTTRRLLYRADLGNWTLIDTLLDASESPFPRPYDDLLTIGVFARLASRHGKVVGPDLGVVFSRLMQRFKAQYRQKVPAPNTNVQPFLRPTMDGPRSALNVSGRSLF